MTTVGVVGRIFYDGRRDRIEVDVDDELFEIGEVLDEFCLVATLPQRARGSMSKVVVLAEKVLGTVLRY
jgi:hypothetical protein